MAQVTGDPSTSTLIIQFNNDWAAKNYDFNGCFTFYAFLAYNCNVLYKRASGGITFGQPANVTLVPVAGVNLKFLVTLKFTDATNVVNIFQLPLPQSEITIVNKNAPAVDSFPASIASTTSTTSAVLDSISIYTTLVIITDCDTLICDKVVPDISGYVTYCPSSTVATFISCYFYFCFSILISFLQISSPSVVSLLSVPQLLWPFFLVRLN